MFDDHGWHHDGRRAWARRRPCPREAALSAGARARELRVMIVTDQYEPMVGGVPTVTRELAVGLAGRGHAVAVLAGRGAGRGWRAAGGVPVACGGSGRWPWSEGQRLGLRAPARAGELI